MRAPARVLLVFKRSTYERYGGARSSLVDRLVAGGDRSVENLLEEHESHHRSVDAARRAVRVLGLRGRFVHKIGDARVRDYDLVVTLGGDGTLLTASHAVGRDQPVLAINSAPGTSMGYFCAGSGDQVTEVLASAIAGSLRETSLTRMQLDVDGRTFHRRVLNDVLFCHANPAAATRYFLAHAGRQEAHLSSGLWVGPAAGSTAAQRSAGGRVLPPSSKKLQYVVREPYLGRDVRLRLTKGLVREGESLVVLSQIREGMLYVDGHELARKVDIGSEIRLFRSDEPLTLLGLRR